MDVVSIDELFNPNNKYTFLAGAGVSIAAPSNLPSARAIVETLVNLFAPKEHVKEILSLENLRYENIVEKIHRYHDQNLLFLDYFDFVTNPNIIHFFLAYAILSNQNVLTTNFDYLIERALMKILPEFEHQSIFPVISRGDYDTYWRNSNSFKNKHFLFKIHGSKKNIITGKNIQGSLRTTITSLGQNKPEVFEIESYKKGSFFKILKDRVLVIMGYSGSDIFDISFEIKNCKDNLKALVWVEHSPNKEYTITKVENNDYLIKINPLLTSIKSRSSLPIYLIKADTSKFVGQILFSKILPKETIPEIQTFSQYDSLVSFQDWVLNKYPYIDNVSQYQLSSDIFESYGRYDESLQCLEQISNLALQNKDKKSLIWYMSRKALIYRHRGDFDHALMILEPALQQAIDANNIEYRCLFLIEIGYLKKIMGDAAKALLYFTEGLKFAIPTENLDLIAHCLTNIGWIYHESWDYQSAFDIYMRALIFLDQTGNLELKTQLLFRFSSYQNEMVIYRRLKHQCNQEEDELQSYNEFFEVVKLSQELQNLHDKADALYSYADNLMLIMQYSLALDRFKDAISIYQKLEDLYGRERCLGRIGICYAYGGFNDDALRNLEEAMRIAEIIKDFKNLALYLEFLCVIQSRVKNIGSLRKYQFLLIAIEEKMHKDVIEDIEIQKTIANNLDCIAKTTLNLPISFGDEVFKKPIKIFASRFNYLVKRIYQKLNLKEGLNSTHSESNSKSWEDYSRELAQYEKFLSPIKKYQGSSEDRKNIENFVSKVLSHAHLIFQDKY